MGGGSAKQVALARSEFGTGFHVSEVFSGGETGFGDITSACSSSFAGWVLEPGIDCRRGGTGAKCRFKFRAVCLARRGVASLSYHSGTG